MSNTGLPQVDAGISTTIEVPGSKSVTLRAMACAAMAEGRSHLYGALEAEDSEAMARALGAFGVRLERSAEPWVIDGLGRHLRAPESPIDAGESGLTARIGIVLATLADGGDTTIDGRGRLRERPIAGLVDSMTAQGVAASTTDGHLPVTVSGQSGMWGGPIEVDCSETSQFATAILLGAPMATRPTTLKLVGLEGSIGYLDVTTEVMESFGASVTPTITGFEISTGGYVPADYLVEPDVSAAVYPMVAAAITRSRVEVSGVWRKSRQPDIGVADVLERMGCLVEEGERGVVIDARNRDLVAVDVDLSGLPDGALGVVVACLFAAGQSRLRGLSSLRHKESDRLTAISEEAASLGGDVTVEGDEIVVSPRQLHGGEIDPRGDHRIAMSLALIGMVVEGVTVAHPAVVNKTWPAFWNTLTSGFAN